MPKEKKIWSEMEENYLREHGATDTCTDMARYLGVSAPTVSAKLREMGFEISRRGGSQRKLWSQYELDYIREHYPSEAAVDIADVLGVSTVLIRSKALEMGLKKSADYDRRKYFNRYVKNYRNNIRKVA